MSKKKARPKSRFSQNFLAVPTKRVEDGTTEATLTEAVEETSED